MDQEPPEFGRLREIIERFGYGQIVEIVCREGRPVRVKALVEFNLEQPVSVRLRRLPLDKH